MITGFFAFFSARTAAASSSASGRGRRGVQMCSLEEAFGIVVGLGLHVLAQRQRHRPAFGRVGQHLHGAVERGDDLFGPRDAVEVARHRAEAVVGRNGAVAEILDLLQHRDRAGGWRRHRRAEAAAAGG